MEPHQLTLTVFILSLSVLMAVTSTGAFPQEVRGDRTGHMIDGFSNDIDLLPLQETALIRLLSNLQSSSSEYASGEDETYPMVASKRSRSGRKLRFCMDVIRNTWRLCRNTRSN
ncbi:uncharacterized protein LOC115926197 [Strongylocentrotus purpuratus]|uniref:Melanin-concentrating hormone n=1 Tax=Strongylocentrotus purpuratus TaxID=7668 RepID=A0A7M7T1E0_STRPU|nr:uncharacterized protein LOC115926197 [Strongylocentrotus purpuratus]